MTKKYIYVKRHIRRTKKDKVTGKRNSKQYFGVRNYWKRNPWAEHRT